MNKYDKRHIANVRRYQRQIDAIYKQAAAEVAARASTLPAPEDGIFSFDDFPAIKAQIDSLMAQMAGNIEFTVNNGVHAEWALANDKNDALVESVLGGDVSLAAKYHRAHNEARDAFLARKVSGLNLSDRVWRYTNQFKDEIEMGLDCGIRDGLDAPQMARRLEQYLDHPDKLFRRIRDERGVLQLSKRAAAYHPGRGVYRSSYKNARRLAATETNIAYRTSDHERWKDLDFVVGIKISLSNNHTCLNNKGQAVPFMDICDTLAGNYPKDFKFTGWHPHCRCIATPILKTKEEIEADNERILRGEEPSDPKDSENAVKELPEDFQKWIDDNLTRVVRTQQLPYFITDNAEAIVGVQAAKYPSTKLAEVMMSEHAQEYLQLYHHRTERFDTLFEQYNTAQTDIGKAIALNQLKREAASICYQDLRLWGMIDDSFTLAKTEFDSVVQENFWYIGKDGKPALIAEKKLDLIVLKDQYGREFAYKMGINPYHAFSSVEASAAINEFPPYLSEGIKRVSFLDIPCPTNPYWRFIYNDPNFEALATDGGTTQFFMYPQSKEQFKGYMAHEAAHILDGEMHKISNSRLWQEAVAKDDEIYKQYNVRMRVSPYAMKNDSEDFAECMKKYITDHEYMKRWYPNRSAFIREMAQRVSGHYPRRP